MEADLVPVSRPWRNGGRSLLRRRKSWTGQDDVPPELGFADVPVPCSHHRGTLSVRLCSFLSLVFTVGGIFPYVTKGTRQVLWKFPAGARSPGHSLGWSACAWRNPLQCHLDVGNRLRRPGYVHSDPGRLRRPASVLGQHPALRTGRRSADPDRIGSGCRLGGERLYWGHRSGCNTSRPTLSYICARFFPVSSCSALTTSSTGGSEALWSW